MSPEVLRLIQKPGLNDDDENYDTESDDNDDDS